ncbi:RNA polymerase sigma factor [Planctomycetes bacterium Pan216]|uniref:RNA polymerase sigma factor n=1 Tax=Kolteria novifilia TaxID=2527975 RepID=A0A518B2U1_9BACT|nr:RNA polymerase sigma factor [Planctomycetes bacterium Pan216]
MTEEAESVEVIEALRTRGAEAVAEFFARHRQRLAMTVHLRMDRRIKPRVDEDDILQESCINAISRLHHYLNDPSMSFFVWLRLIVGQTLCDVHRRHLGSKKRDAGREVSIRGGRQAAASSLSIVGMFVGQLTSPSQAAIKAELTGLLEEALEQMNPIDREVLSLRHLEELTNSEVAEVLNIEPKAASIRYIRAIGRLKGVLKRFPGFFDET